MTKKITSLTGIEERFEEYVRHLNIGTCRPGKTLYELLCGFLAAGREKEPMAAVVAPDRVSGTHQMMHHFVANAEWSDEALQSAVESYVLPRMEA